MFNATVQKEHLETVLKLLSSTVGDNSQGFNDDCISIVPSANLNTLVLCTTDTINFTKCEVLCGLCQTPDPAPLVNFKRFEKIISSIPNGEMITLKETKQNVLTVSYKLNSGVSLTGIGGTFNTLIPNFSNTNVSIGTQFLKESVTEANSIIQNDGKPSLYNCVSIKTSNLLDIEVVGIDTKSNRAYINTIKSSTSNPDSEFIIDAQALKSVIGLFDGYSEVLLCKNSNDTMIKITPDTSTLIPDLSSDHITNFVTSIEYYRRIIVGTFSPIISKKFAMGVLQNTSVNIKELQGSLKRVLALEDGNSGHQYVGLTANDKINITYTSTYGEISESLISGNPLANQTGGKYPTKALLELLSTNTEESIMFGELNGSPGVLIFSNSDKAKNGQFMITPAVQNNNP